MSILYVQGHLLLLQRNSSLVVCDKQLMNNILSVLPAVTNELCKLPDDQLQELLTVLRKSLTAAGTFQQVRQLML